MTNQILTDALDAYAAYHDSLPDPSIDAATILANLDMPLRFELIDETDDPDYARAFYIFMQYDACPLDILAMRTSPDAFSYFIAIDSSEYIPMIPAK